MIILGCDPGFAITGYGVVESKDSSLKLIEYGAVNTKAGELFSYRLIQINDGIKNMIEKYRPDAFAIEELFFNNNSKTAIAAAQGRGAALLAAAQMGVPCYEYTPLQVKQAVAGYGRAEKTQIQHMVKVILKLNEIPKPDDAADAIAIAICHSFHKIGSERI